MQDEELFMRLWMFDFNPGKPHYIGRDEIWIVYSICERASWSTHRPVLFFLFDLNVEVKRLDEHREGTAYTPGYPGVIGSGVDYRRTWRMHFD